MEIIANFIRISVLQKQLKNEVYFCDKNRDEIKVELANCLFKRECRKLKYHDHAWKVCVDIKVLNMLQGQQSGYTKFPCLLCKWLDSRDKKNHWVKREWPTSVSRTLGQKNITNPALVESSKIPLGQNPV